MMVSSIPSCHSVAAGLYLQHRLPLELQSHSKVSLRSQLQLTFHASGFYRSCLPTALFSFSFWRILLHLQDQFKCHLLCKDFPPPQIIRLSLLSVALACGAEPSLEETEGLSESKMFSVSAKPLTGAGGHHMIPVWSLNMKSLEDRHWLVIH